MQMVAFFLYAHGSNTHTQREGERDGCSLFLFLRGQQFHPGGSTIMISSIANYLPKAPSPNTMTLMIRVSTYEFGWVRAGEGVDTNIQSTTQM